VRSVIVGSLLVVVGCGGASEPTATTVDPVGMAQAVAAGISADTLLAEVERLASDAFEGRAPGSEGETRTIEYLREQFSTLGLAPGNPDGTWVQNVPLVGITPVEGDTLRVSRGDDTRTLEPGADYVAYTKRVVDRVEVDAEFVFVGYGAVAPEYDWNDFKDVDVTGKILLFLVNDPPSDGLFGGQAMTYYGRWTYKHEIAAEKGAAGSLVIHELGPAGYPWEVVGSSPYGESFDLVSDDRNMGRAAIEGWIRRDAAASLFEMAGLDFATEKAKAARADFQPVELGVTGRTQVRNTLRTIDSQNVVAMLPGAGAPDEVVIYMARDRHSRADRAGARLHPGGAPASVSAVPGRDRRGARAARLTVLRRAPALPRGADRGGVEHGRAEPVGSHPRSDGRRHGAVSAR